MGRCTLDTPVIPSRAGSMNTIVTSDPIYQRSHGGTQQQCRSLSCLTTTFWSRNIGTGTSSKGKWQRLSSTLTTWRGRMENPWAGCGSLLLTPWRKTPSGTMHSHLGALKKKRLPSHFPLPICKVHENDHLFSQLHFLPATVLWPCKGHFPMHWSHWPGLGCFLLLSCGPCLYNSTDFSPNTLWTWRQRQHIPQKCWYAFKILLVTFKQIIIWTITAIKTPKTYMDKIIKFWVIWCILKNLKSVVTDHIKISFRYLI